jgi:hypothetical membrane protein
MAIDEKDLVQINATIIAGLLVLLGVSNLLPGFGVTNSAAAMIATEVFIVPFAIALITGLYGKTRASKHLTALGLSFIIIGLLLLILVNIFPEHKY